MKIAQPKMWVRKGIRVVVTDRFVSMPLDVHRKPKLLRVRHRVGYVGEVSINIPVRNHLTESDVTETHPMNQGLTQVIGLGQVA